MMATHKRYQTIPSKGFAKELKKLSTKHQQMVLDTTVLMEIDPHYPSLRTKRLKGQDDLYESSVNMSIRIIWEFDGDKIIVMLDVGHHDILKKY